MGLVSSETIAYFRCAFLLTVAFFLVKSPETIVFNTYVLFFSQIFNTVVVDTLADTKNEPVVGILAMFMTLNALSDLVAIFSISNLFVKPPILDAQNLADLKENENAKARVDSKELYYTYFENLVPIRLLFFFTITALSYLSENVMISNNLTTVYGFIEIWFNFVIFNNLRDEKVQRYKRGYFDMQEKERVEFENEFDVDEEEVKEVDDESI